MEIRTLLFWTFNKKGQKSYDTDFQETKLTLIIGLAKSIWRSLGKDERVKMLFVVFHVFNTCQKAYKETCHTTFLNFELVPTMIQIMDGFGKLKKEKPKKLKNGPKRWHQMMNYLIGLENKARYDI